MCMTFDIKLQSKAGVDKVKSTLEAENQDLASDLKQVQMAKQESERKRKQAEAQLQEATIKLQETDRNKGDISEKYTKTVVCLYTICMCCL